MNETRKQIIERCDAIKSLLLEKNSAYGDSAIVPLGIMAQGDALDLIAVRIDDKLSRIANFGGLVAAMDDSASEDTVNDLIGYLILAEIAHRRQGGREGGVDG